MLSWDDAQDKFRADHLVSGYFDPDRLNRLVQLKRLIIAMKPEGRWAVQGTEEKGEWIVQVLFELLPDAVLLADNLEAKRGTGMPGYGSSAWFEY